MELMTQIKEVSQMLADVADDADKTKKHQRLSDKSVSSAIMQLISSISDHNRCNHFSNRCNPNK